MWDGGGGLWKLSTLGADYSMMQLYQMTVADLSLKSLQEQRLGLNGSKLSTLAIIPALEGDRETTGVSASLQFLLSTSVHGLQILAEREAARLWT